VEEQQIAPYLTFENIKDIQTLENIIYANYEFHYYWSDDWSPEFYVALAYAGFISTSTHDHELGTILLSDLHTAYAVLDWKNLHISKSIKRTVRKNILDEEKIYLKINSDTRNITEKIGKAHADISWLTDKYKRTLNLIDEQSLIQFNFKLLAIEMWSEKENQLIAGELGYTIGESYTSLTGFFDRETPRYNNMGKIQLIALAKLLEQAGYKLWNLGQPQLKYKIDLGAKEVERVDFLKRLKKARNNKLENALHYLEGKKIYCEQLLDFIIEKPVEKEEARV
jgi:Leu/Phe-tRNA-protein transferase